MLFKVSEDEVKKAKQYISRNLVGHHGIRSVATSSNKDNNGYHIFLGIEDASRMLEATTAISELRKAGKIAAVIVEIQIVGRAVIQNETMRLL